jgi:hypothetical protein
LCGDLLPLEMSLLEHCTTISGHLFFNENWGAYMNFLFFPGLISTLNVSMIVMVLILKDLQFFHNITSSVSHYGPGYNMQLWINMKYQKTALLSKTKIGGLLHKLEFQQHIHVFYRNILLRWWLFAQKHILLSKTHGFPFFFVY